jgi:(2R)-3-sulfolactate dehydrogenase (NADP+)
MTMSTEEKIILPVVEARKLTIDACMAAGASQAAAQSIADATLSAAQFGREGQGFPHLVDYLASLREGRIKGNAQPIMQKPLPALICLDARGGIAQLGFDLAFDDFVACARNLGIAAFFQKNSYTTGELGYYVRRLASEGLVALAATSGPALMAASPGGKRVYCTNPLAFGAAVDGPQQILVIDQASSATSFVSIVHAAAEGRAIPPGWATDENGEPTTDPSSAMKGALLPFGGYKGANIALMVEILAAGMSGAPWALDAHDFRSGNQCPGAGLTIIAIAADAMDKEFRSRLEAQLGRLEHLGVRVPGRRGATKQSSHDSVAIGKSIVEQMKACSATAFSSEVDTGPREESASK